MIKFQRNLLICGFLLSFGFQASAASDDWVTNFVFLGHSSSIVRSTAIADLNRQSLNTTIHELEKFLSKRMGDKPVVSCLDYLVKRDPPSIVRLHNVVKNHQSANALGFYLSCISASNAPGEVIADLKEWLSHTSAVVRVRCVSLLKGIVPERKLIMILTDACDSEESEIAGDPPDRAGRFAKDLLLTFSDRGSVLEGILTIQPRGNRHKYHLLDLSARLEGITQKFLYSHLGEPLLEETKTLDAINVLINRRREAVRN